MQWPWDTLTSELLELILVEADPLEAKRLKRGLATQAGTVLPVALWRDEQPLPLFLNASPGTSSVYPANRDLLEQFPDVGRFQCLETTEMRTRTIDSLVSAREMPAVDFAKMDVQGAELAILEGGARHLSSNLIGLEVEVEFAPIYSDCGFGGSPGSDDLAPLAVRTFGLT